MTDETSQLLSDTAEKLFSDHVTKNCIIDAEKGTCLLYTSPSPRDGLLSRMPSSA